MLCSGLLLDFHVNMHAVFSSESVIFSDASSQRMGRDKPTVIASKDHYYITSTKSVLGIGSWEIYTYIIYVFLASRQRFRHLKCWVFQGLSVVQVMKEETPAFTRSACYFALIRERKAMMSYIPAWAKCRCQKYTFSLCWCIDTDNLTTIKVWALLVVGFCLHSYSS